MNPDEKKDAAGRAVAPSETTKSRFKHSNTLAQTQHDSVVPFGTIAAAVHAQQAGARFAADIVAQPSLPDALFIRVCEYFSDTEFLKNFLRAVQKSLERGSR